MATEIKILKCPQCGGTDKTDLKKDVFQCNSCKTTYYLENDDVDINYSGNRLKTASPVIKKWIPLLIGFAIFFSLFLAIYMQQLNSKPPQRAAAIIEVLKEKEEKKDKYRGTILASFPITATTTKKPFLIQMEVRTYHDEKKGSPQETLYLKFYDPLEKQMLREVKIDLILEYSRNIYLKTFSNNRIYLIHSTDIYEVDAESLEVNLVTNKLFTDLHKAQEGLKSLKFTEDGDGLEMVTSQNQKIYYFLQLNKTYSPESYEKAAHGFASLLPGAQEVTYHQFIESENEYSNYKLQLLRIRYLDNGAGPKTFQKFFIWTKDYIMGVGYKVVLVIPDLKELRRITSYKDITPGRNYYAPMVVYEDKSTLLIRFRANANNTAPYKLQRLDKNTGKVIWTVPLLQGKDIEKLYRYKNGYYSYVADSIVLFDLGGTSIDSFNN